MKAGKKELFSNSSFELGTGLYALLGRNGTGKSTFLSALMNEHECSGEMLINGRAVSLYSNAERAKEMSVVRSRPQIYGDYSVYDILMLGRLPYQNLLAIPSSEDKLKVEEVAGLIGISDLLNQAYNSLSDGERQLVMIGRALVQDTPIILLDEPGAFLDLVNRVQLVKTLKKLSQDKLILFSTHHVEVLSSNCDGILIIDEKKMNFYNNSAEFDAVIQSTFNLEE